MPTPVEKTLDVGDLVPDKSSTWPGPTISSPATSAGLVHDNTLPDTRLAPYDAPRDLAAIAPVP